MHIFDYSFLDEGLLPAEIVNLTATITAFNAISDTRKESNKSIYTELEKIARVQSVKGSNAIEGIVTTDARIKQIVDGDSAPLNHDEREIAGYRDALDEIHSKHDQMSFSENMILHIHETMTNLAGYELSGKYKTEDNLIMEIDERGRRRVRFTPVSAADTGEAMQQLVLAYMDARDNPKINKLLLIPCVILDFLCIHPFSDGNGRTARLMSGYILDYYGYGFNGIGSLEEYFAYDPDEYYASLQMGLPALYYSGRENPPHPEIWINYFLRMMVLYSKKVYELSKESENDELDGSLSYLNAKEKEFLAFLLKKRLYEFTPIEVSKMLGVTNKTIINRCAKLVNNGLLIPIIVKTRIRSYRLSDFSKTNEKKILKKIS